MTRSIILLLISSGFFLFACRQSVRTRHYKHVGLVTFRRTYAGHENMSQAELDSVIRSNPSYLIESNSAAANVLAILNKLGIGDRELLYVDKIARDLKDTLVIDAHNA